VYHQKKKCIIKWNHQLTKKTQWCTLGF
jgi:hypothetical protein